MVSEMSDAVNEEDRPLSRKQGEDVVRRAGQHSENRVTPSRPRDKGPVRHILVSLAVVFLVIVSLFNSGQFAWGAVTQDATPPSGAQPPLGGTTIELLDTGEPMDTPGKVLNFVRLTLEPGGYLNAHGHPGAQIWYIDAGTISTTVMEGTMRLTQPSGGATPAPTKEIGPGMEILMSEGESVFFDKDVIHTVENTGDEQAVILIAAVLEASEPEVIFAEHDGHEEATPTS